MKKLFALILCATVLVSCSSMNNATDVLANTGSLVNTKSVTLIGVTAAIGKKPELSADFTKVSEALRKVTDDNAVTVDDLKNIVLESLAQSSTKNKSLVMTGLSVVFDYYGNRFVLDEGENTKYVIIINAIADGIDEALKLNYLTKGEVPASTK